MNFNTPHNGMDRQVGRWSLGTFSACPPSPLLQHGDNKSWHHGFKVALLPLRPMCAGGIKFSLRLFGLIPTLSLQAKVNFMPGQGVFMLQWRWGANRCCVQPLFSGGGSTAAKYESWFDQSKWSFCQNSGPVRWCYWLQHQDSSGEWKMSWHFLKVVKADRIMGEIFGIRLEVQHKG